MNARNEFLSFSQFTDLLKTKELVDSLKSVEKVEILPYHSLGRSKWDKLDFDYPLGDTPAPTQEQIKHAESILHL